MTTSPDSTLSGPNTAAAATAQLSLFGADTLPWPWEEGAGLASALSAGISAPGASRALATAGAANEAEADAARAAELWIENPVLAFANWKRSQPRVPVPARADDDARASGNARGFEEHSLAQYRAMWGGFIRWIGEHRRTRDVRTIDAADIDSFLASLRGGRKGDRPVAPSTQRRYLFLLHRTFEHLRLLQLRQTNPCAQFDQLSSVHASPRPPRRFLSPSQREAFIDWCNAQPVTRWEYMRNRALRLVLLGSGLTVSEARLLRVQDVLVEPAAQRDTSDHGALPSISLVIPAHGEAPARHAPLDALAVPAMLQWLQCRASAVRPAGDLVFNARRRDGLSTTQGCPAAARSLSAEELYDVVSQALQGIGFDGDRTGAATLRNTFMAHHIRAGTPLALLRDWVGLRTTQQLQLLQRQVPDRRPSH